MNSSLTSSATKDSVIPLVFSIQSEISCSSYAGSTEHSIRAAFERAVEPGEAGAHSVSIWKWYLLWELKVAEFGAIFSSSNPRTRAKLSRAQNVFYRGIRSCPWAKQMYMLEFTQEGLRNDIGFEGLKKIYETMVEKGIRIHVDLSGFL